MEIDIAIIIIVGIFAFLGLKNGMIYTLFRTIGWLVAIVVAVLFHGMTQKYLMEHTPIYDGIYGRVEAACLTFVEKYAGGVADGIGGSIGGALNELANKIAVETAEKIAMTAFGIFVFIVMILLIKLILFLITRLFSKRYHKGFIGGIDGIGGLFLGIAQGLIVAFVLLAFVMPVSFAINPAYYQWVNTTMAHSFFAYNLYEANPLLHFAGTFNIESLLPKTPAITDRVLDQIQNGNRAV